MIEGGVYIGAVEDDSVAGNSGVQRGTVLVSIDDMPVLTATDASVLLGAAGAASELALGVLSENGPLTVLLKIP